jgi:hypothetical protein
MSYFSVCGHQRYTSGRTEGQTERIAVTALRTIVSKQPMMKQVQQGHAMRQCYSRL